MINKTKGNVKLKNKKMAIAVALSAALLVSCSTTNNANISSSVLVNIPLAPLAPSAEELKQEQKVVLLPFEMTEELHIIAAANGYPSLEQALMKAGNSMIERDIAARMRSELLVAEKTGKYRTSGLQAADIAVMVKVVNIDLSRKFTKSDSWTDKKGKHHTSPAKCNFNSTSKLFVRAYRLPDMIQIGTFDFEGDASSSTETSNSSCPLSTASAESLISRATETAIIENQYKLLNELVPAYYVIERRQQPGDKSKALFRTSLTNTQGAKQGTKVNFYRRELKTNQLTQEQFVEEVLLTSGEITNQIDRNGSYVLVKGVNEIEKLMLGDVVRMEHERCPEGYFSFLGSCNKNLELF